MAPRILFVHAHPDDETITTGGTIAKYAAEGAHVVVLTCTLGEEGDVLGEGRKYLHAQFGDQLGGFRAWELSNALRELGLIDPRFLGGAGRWRDSGMVGSISAKRARAFANSPMGEIVEELSTIIQELRPHVVVSYDRGGGYGHPDHIRAAEATALAVLDAATSPSLPRRGTPWSVAKLYASVVEATDLAQGLLQISKTDPGRYVPQHGELFSVSDLDVTTTIDISEHMEAKVRALREHQTQLFVEESQAAFTISSGTIQPIAPREHFILIHGQTGETGSDGRENDLLSGVDTCI